MSNKKFFTNLVISIVVSVVIHFFINLFLPIAKYNDILIYSIIFFTVICLLIYWLSILGIKTKQSNFFLFIVIINVFLKLVAAFVFILLYVRANKPEDKYFLVPFLMTYLIFTLFETIFLSRQARLSN